MTHSTTAVKSNSLDKKCLMETKEVPTGIELTKQIKLENIFSENDFVSTEFYILVDRNGKDCYPFPIGEIDEWKKDGSFERGDTLYKMNRLMTF